jgi:hypothetical protein
MLHKPARRLENSHSGGAKTITPFSEAAFEGPKPIQPASADVAAIDVPLQVVIEVGAVGDNVIGGSVGPREVAEQRGADASNESETRVPVEQGHRKRPMPSRGNAFPVGSLPNKGRQPKAFELVPSSWR